jgi:hypothetical protein
MRLRLSGSSWRDWRSIGGTVAENSSVWRAFRRFAEDELQLLAKAEVEHLVGLVEHHGAHRPRGRSSRA